MFSIKNVKYKGILNISQLLIPAGKITCIIGKSGSGKTTFLRLLNNLISADSGKIYYKGIDINEINPLELRREVVMLSQEPVIFNGTIKDNLNMGLKFSEKNAAGDKKLSEVLDKIQLCKSLDAPAEKLSGGEKQRLALGRVLLLEPEVLLLDEPSSSLDENTEQTVIENVVGYARLNDRTLIMVTHTGKIAKKYGDFIIKIHEGNVKTM